MTRVATNSRRYVIAATGRDHWWACQKLGWSLGSADLLTRPEQVAGVREAEVKVVPGAHRLARYMEILDALKRNGLEPEYL